MHDGTCVSTFLYRSACLPVCVRVLNMLAKKKVLDVEIRQCEMSLHVPLPPETRRRRQLLKSENRPWPRFSAAGMTVFERCRDCAARSSAVGLQSGQSDTRVMEDPVAAVLTDAVTGKVTLHKSAKRPEVET